MSKPLLGEVVPGVVRGSVEVDLERYRGEIRSEWESLREHDGMHIYKNISGDMY